MSRSKKSRSGGSLAARKEADFKSKRKVAVQKASIGKGKPSGNRQQEAQTPQQQQQTNTVVDKRVGSKKPIALVSPNSQKAAVVSPKKPKPKAKVLSPEQELEQLENNTRLSNLLDESDAGQELNAVDQQWLDKQLARHQQLMEQLGLIEADDEPEARNDEDRLWSSLNSGSLDQYKE